MNLYVITKKENGVYILEYLEVNRPGGFYYSRSQKKQAMETLDRLNQLKLPLTTSKR